MKQYIIALDQGTTSSRCILFDNEQNIVCVRQKLFTQYFPKPGWVEHDPIELLASQKSVMEEVVDCADVEVTDIAAIGITNQRETTIIWEKDTGKPIYNAIVWQCRRTAEICEQLKRDGHSDYIKENTGLLIDAYFSATKVKWILDNVPGARSRAERGELLFGTVDTWLLWNLTQGAVHATDLTNASRTMMFNIRTLEWDETILKILDIPKNMLPEVKHSGDLFGYAHLYGTKIPIAGMAGDQQAALYGQTCFLAGQTKCTYGTGCFMLMNTGKQLYYSKNGLINTIAATQKGTVHYALEGSVFVGGAVVQWLRDELHLISDSKDSEYFAQKVPDNGGVYFVPAFTGLGAPHWDMYARGTMLGLTRGSKGEHIVRAALEAIAYQVADVAQAMKKDTGIEQAWLKVDGGASANNFLMQFQADILNRPVIRSRLQETTALGAAYLAGLSVGVFESTEQIARASGHDGKFEPKLDDKTRETLLANWTRAVRCAKEWHHE